MSGKTGGPRIRIRFLRAGEGGVVAPLWQEWLGLDFGGAMAALDAGELATGYEHLQCAMVAEDRETHRPLGLLLAGPAVNFLNQLPPEVRYTAASLITKLSGLAVDPSCRGAGVGMKMLLRCINEYRMRDYQWIYGQFDRSAALERFYRRAQFQVHPPGQTMIAPAVAGGTEFRPNSPNEQWFQRLLR